MKKRTKVFLGIGLIVLAMAALMVLGLSRSQTYYVTLEELLSQPAARADQQLRVNGKLIGSSVTFDPDQVLLRFELTDGRRTLPVAYKGVRPGSFEDGSDVLVEGRFRDGVFIAENVLTKCPSKYEAKVKTGQ
ncbi:MAG: cytochrome c maturation protein CcmE [Bacillota bacterium]|nr:cytochrome c maturation protein CcmE [Bacillota bacterium]